jgi:pimeloyl-ACP methyl ester carboxylesterase
MIPGLGGGLDLLGPLAKSLARSFGVIRYQLRGENDSFLLRHPFTLDDLVDDLAEVIDELRLERPTIMRLSFGGIVALMFAIRYPNRVGRLIVQGVGARFERGLLQKIASTVLWRFPLPADNPFVNQFFKLLFGGRPQHDKVFEFVTQQIWQTDQSVMAHRFRLIEDFDVADDVKHIRAPTLVFSSERDVLVSRKSLAPLCRNIADVRVSELTSCGHLAFVTKPDAIVERVNHFMKT